MISRNVLVASIALGNPVFAQQGQRLWQEDERVVITDFSSVQAIAATQEILYVVSTGGIGVYDRRFHRWEAPFTRLDGLSPIRARLALVDPVDQSLWIGDDGALIHYEPRLRTLTTIPVMGGVRQIVFDARDAFAGVFVQSPRAWEFLARGARVTRDVRRLPVPERRIRGVTTAEVEARYPFVTTMKARALVDDRLRRYRFTAATEVELTNEVFLGTDGYGVIRVDLLTSDFERMPFGLLAPAARSVQAAPGGVWVGSGPDGTSRSGLTFVASDLQEFRYEEGPAVTGLGSTAVQDIAVRNGVLWAATDAGVVRLAPGRPLRRFTTSQGLRSERVRTLAPGDDGVWVGTRLGLSFASDDGGVAPVGEIPVSVNALLVSRDTVWVGSRQGLGVSWAGMNRIVVPPDIRDVPILANEIVALARSGETIVAATRERIAWRRPDGTWDEESVLSSQLGELTAVAPDSGSVWVAGERGIARFRFNERDYVFVSGAHDVPRELHDLTVADGFVWVATDMGLVRFTRSRIVP